MNTIANLQPRYLHILEQTVSSVDVLAREAALAEAFDLGRVLLATAATPDDIVALHHETLEQYAQRHPYIRLEEVASRLTLPLMDLTMAHGMAFREQLQRRHQGEVAERLSHATRLEALGTLAAGVAHDFNTLLGSITGYAELTGDELAPDSVGQAHLRQILIACGRARDLIRRMLDFARQRPAAPVAQDLGAEVQATLAMLQPSLALDIQVQFDHHPLTGPAWVLADAGQLQQIVLNLCINAADALDGRGDLHLELGLASAADAAPPGHGDDFCLRVSDTGCGMPPEVQARVFEPFFTTKAPKGSGLGLSVVYGIVQQLGGDITLSSRSSGPNTGTTFRIFLPPLTTAPRKDSTNGTHPGH
ncbi:MAG: histidine kinase [Rhodoferax sp.]|nr:histidine kinase [Rhodoferax sp.]